MYDDLKKPMSVYIVDDDKLSTVVLEDYLKKMFGNKMNVMSFETGESCLAAIASHIPNLVILDYHLDSKTKEAANGIAILKKIKDHNEGVDVIMLSGQAKIDVAIETMRLGARDYVVKGETANLHIAQILKSMIEVANQRNQLELYKLAFWIATSIIAIIILGVLSMYFFFPEHTRYMRI